MLIYSVTKWKLELALQRRTNWLHTAQNEKKSHTIDWPKCKLCLQMNGIKATHLYYFTFARYRWWFCANTTHDKPIKWICQMSHLHVCVFFAVFFFSSFSFFIVEWLQWRNAVSSTAIYTVGAKNSTKEILSCDQNCCCSLTMLAFICKEAREESMHSRTIQTK